MRDQPLNPDRHCAAIDARQSKLNEECDCGECPDCLAAKASDRLRSQNSLVIRMERRVLELLERAIAS